MLCFSKKGLKVDDDPPLIPRKQSRNILKKIRDKVFKKGKKNPQNAPLPDPPLPTNSSPIPSLLNNPQPIPNPLIPGRRFEMTLDITKPYPLYNAMNGIRSNPKNTIPSDPKKTIIFSTSCSNFLRVEELEVSEGIQKEKGSESDSQRNTGEVIELQDCIEKEQANGSIEEVTNLLPLDTTEEELEVPEGIEGNNSEYERKTVTHELPLEITTDEPIIFSNFPRIEEVEVPEGIKENDDNNAIEAVPPQVKAQLGARDHALNVCAGENEKAIVTYKMQPERIEQDEELEVPEGIEEQGNNSEYERKTVTHELPLEITTDEPIIFSYFPRIEEVEVPEGIKENDDNNAIEGVPPQVKAQLGARDHALNVCAGENEKAIVTYKMQPEKIEQDKPVVRSNSEGHDSVDEDVPQVEKYQGNTSESEEVTQKQPLIITDESDSDKLEKVLKVFEVQEGIKGQIREPCGGQVDATLRYILIFLILFIIIIIFLYLFIKLS